MEDAITTVGLTKKFKDKLAVDNLDMHVPKGAIYGFIGRNGAGKSTAQKLICGLLLPSSGKIKLNGKPYTDRDERAKIGVLIENPGYFPQSSAYDNLIIQALNLGLKSPKKLVNEALASVGLGDVGKKHVSQFSLGMKQRLGIATALLGSPELLILDEPINGLDPQGIMDIRNVILNLNREKGVTVLISSHILGELSKMATHYGIIANGKMVKEITAEDLSNESKDYLNIKTDKPMDAATLLKNELNVTTEISGYELRVLGYKDFTTMFVFLNVTFRSQYGFSILLTCFLGIGVFSMLFSFLGENVSIFFEWLNRFTVFGSGSYATLMPNGLNFLNILLVSVAWTILYGFLSSIMLRKRDLL